MTSKIIRGAKITLPDSAKTETIAPTATAYKMLTGTSLGGVLNDKGISDSIGVVGTIGTGEDRINIEGLGANPGFIIHNLVPRADQLPATKVQVEPPSPLEPNIDETAEPSESDTSNESAEINPNPIQEEI